MITPEKTIGILGGGQIGRMMAFEAKRMGYKVICLDPTENSPCGQVCDEQIKAGFEDEKSALELAEKSDVITYEFENVKSTIVEAIEKTGKKVYPDSNALKVSQNRIREKNLFKSLGIKTTEFIAVRNKNELEEAIKKIGFPAIIKTAETGYDGKRHKIVKNPEESKKTFEETKAEAIFEKKVEFEKEISVICARSKNQIIFFPISENIHKNNILHETIVPARVEESTAKKAIEAAKKVAEKLDYVGVMCIEFFLDKKGEILANEMAPRPHNSGHYSIEACSTSQFEQHIRAICGMPLGSSELIKPTVLINIIAKEKKPDFAKILENENIYLHLYGKKDWKKGRKMGHLTMLGDTQEEVLKKAKELEKLV